MKARLIQKPLARAGAHLAAGRYPEAAGAFRAALGIDPRAGAARLGLADALLAQGRREEAVRDLVQAAQAHTQPDESADALCLFGKAMEIDPQQHDLHLDVAFVEWGAGHHQAAIMRIEGLAEHYMGTGQTERAVELLRFAATWVEELESPAQAGELDQEIEAEPTAITTAASLDRPGVGAATSEAPPVNTETVVCNTILVCPDGTLMRVGEDAAARSVAAKPPPPAPSAAPKLPPRTPARAVASNVPTPAPTASVAPNHQPRPHARAAAPKAPPRAPTPSGAPNHQSRPHTRSAAPNRPTPAPARSVASNRPTPAPVGSVAPSLPPHGRVRSVAPKAPTPAPARSVVPTPPTPAPARSVAPKLPPRPPARSAASTARPGPRPAAPRQPPTPPPASNSLADRLRKRAGLGSSRATSTPPGSARIPARTISPRTAEPMAIRRSAPARLEGEEEVTMRFARPEGLDTLVVR